MIMKMLAVTAFTLSLAGGAYAQTAPMDATQMPANSECPQGKALGIDNKACQDKVQDTNTTGSVTPMAPAAASDPAQDAAAECPQGKALGIDNKSCADKP